MSLNSTDSMDQTSVINRKEASMLANAQRAVLSSTRWLTAEQISKMAGFDVIDFSIQLGHWKSNRQIFAIEHDGIEYFPEYSLNASDNFRPVSVLMKIISLFAESKDSWGLAYWFAGTNGYLGGQRPHELLLIKPIEVLKAAKDELIGISHG